MRQLQYKNSKMKKTIINKKCKNAKTRKRKMEKMKKKIKKQIDVRGSVKKF